jgi:hypothetical protein
VRVRVCLSYLLGLTLFAGALGVKAQTISFDTLPALQVTTPIPRTTHVPGDIDGNGVSDIFWFNPTASQFGYWLMDTNDATGQVSRIGSKTFNVTPGYFVGAIGDFNGDGLADVIFTSNNNDLYLWQNNGQGGFQSTAIGTYPAGWVLIGAGDVDGDGTDDLLWLNPSQCQFGYWLMKNGVHVETSVKQITCGYYPISIGYYTPSNRISIIWSSASHDLYMWDENGLGFTSYNISTPSYDVSDVLVMLGGGYEGTNITLAEYIPNQRSSTIGDGGAGTINRQFNAQGAQTSFSQGGGWEGDVTLPWSSAGELIEGRSTNKTGLIYQYGPSLIGVCPPVGGGAGESGPTPTPGVCPQYSYPSGWYVIGATANGIVP